ncbi:hypothetical protein TNCT_572371 [Trichonephila clavata]|uniref:Uncharacterized protein n=1 Tax=Trichonephila clavata TaxID=2740835 RepID=A0A8X6JAS0_TRICU|nr:hypothetical protein TNCT_572371 [Trichonephila clavata]
MVEYRIPNIERAKYFHRRNIPICYRRNIPITLFSIEQGNRVTKRTCLPSSCWLASWHAPWQCILTDMSLDIPTAMIIWDITTWTMTSTMSTIMTSIMTSRNKDNGR